MEMLNWIEAISTILKSHFHVSVLNLEWNEEGEEEEKQRKKCEIFWMFRNKTKRERESRKKI